MKPSALLTPGRAEGRTKTKLVPDPIRGPIVHEIFSWRVTDRLGYREIADRLNSSLDRYPPPVSPDPARRRETWSRSAVRDILSNPKYTGFMVWNRRATKKGGTAQLARDLGLSDQPTHEPIVTRAMFDAAASVGKTEERSRDGQRANVRHPDTKRSYVLRSFVDAISAAAGCTGRPAGRRCTTHASPATTWAVAVRPAMRIILEAVGPRGRAARRRLEFLR